MVEERRPKPDKESWLKAAEEAYESYQFARNAVHTCASSRRSPPRRKTTSSSASGAVETSGIPPGSASACPGGRRSSSRSLKTAPEFRTKTAPKFPSGIPRTTTRIRPATGGASEAARTPPLGCQTRRPDGARRRAPCRARSRRLIFDSPPSCLPRHSGVFGASSRRCD